PRPFDGIQPRVGVPLLIRPWQASENMASRERLEVESGVRALFGDEGELVGIKDHLQVDMHVKENWQIREPHQDHDPISIQLHRVNLHQSKELMDQGRKGKPKPFQVPPSQDDRAFRGRGVKVPIRGALDSL
ncbi:hypothetical protein PanWU01x14_100530, partial [Parasponia andersonii]